MSSEGQSWRPSLVLVLLLRSGWEAQVHGRPCRELRDRTPAQSLGKAVSTHTFPVGCRLARQLAKCPSGCTSSGPVPTLARGGSRRPGSGSGSVSNDGLGLCGPRPLSCWSLRLVTHVMGTVVGNRCGGGCSRGSLESGLISIFDFSARAWASDLTSVSLFPICDVDVTPTPPRATSEGAYLLVGEQPL